MSSIHASIPLDLAQRVLRWMEQVDRLYPRHADRLFLDARIRLLTVDLRRGDVAAVKRNLAHMEAMVNAR